MTETNDVGRTPPRSGGVFSRLPAVFYAPKRVFAEVDRGSPWWEPLIWASVVNMVISYVVIPIQVQLYRLGAGDVPREEFEQAIARMQSFPIKYLGIVTAPVTVLFVAVLFAAVSYIAVSALSERASFKKHLGICLWASIVWWTGVLASTLVVRARGVDEIRTIRDAMAPFGPAAFVSEASKIWLSILSTLDVFAIWFYVLVAVGVMQVFHLPGRWAVLAVVPIWLLYVFFELLSTRLAIGS